MNGPSVLTPQAQSNAASPWPVFWIASVAVFLVSIDVTVLYAAFPAFDADARARSWNLWGYIDARDGAQAVRRALGYGEPGADVFIIANADTVMTRPNEQLLAEVFPGVPLARPVGPHETLLSIDKARRVLGYEPQHSWRDELAGGPG